MIRDFVNAGATLGLVNETNMARIWNKHKQSNTPLKRKVFVGMSGGVDSSVSAYLLKEAGYNVVGVFIKVWQPEGFPCTAKEDRLDAMRVAAQLEIPFLTLDLEEIYKKEVIDYMLLEYKIGNTPNPDVMCNREVKFGAFLEFALKHGADYIATGHYAQIKKNKDIYEMHVSTDTEKDQTYFLWTLSQTQLAHTLFPVGHLEKKDVRLIADEAKLYTAPKKDSQGLCFVGTISFKDLLKKELLPIEGMVLNEKGEIIGKHDGAILYTLGERHGFTITHKTPYDDAFFVVDRDIKKNTLIVSTKKPEKNAQTEVMLRDLHAVEGAIEDSNVLVRLRYRQKLIPARIEQSKNKPILILKEASLPVKGQSAVIYNINGTKVLGGGIIL